MSHPMIPSNPYDAIRLSPVEREREADAYLKANGFTDCGSTRELLLPPDKLARKIETASDARSARAFSQRQASGALHPSELAAEKQNERLRAHIERREFFEHMTRPCHSAAASLRRAERGLRRLRSVRNKFERAVVVAAIDSDFAETGRTATSRREAIAKALGVSLRTIVTMIVQGRRSIELAKRMAQAEQPTTEKPVISQPISTGAILPNIARAVTGSRFDSRARIAGVAELRVDEQREFVALLERQSVLGEIVELDALDKKARAKMLRHSILDCLDGCNRQNAGDRRTLAAHQTAEQNRIVAEWIAEAIDDATGADTSRSRYIVRQHAQAARDWIAQERAKAETVTGES